MLAKTVTALFTLIMRLRITTSCVCMAPDDTLIFSAPMMPELMFLSLKMIVTNKVDHVSLSYYAVLLVFLVFVMVGAFYVEEKISTLGRNGKRVSYISRQPFISQRKKISPRYPFSGSFPVAYSLLYIDKAKYDGERKSKFVG